MKFILFISFMKELEFVSRVSEVLKWVINRSTKEVRKNKKISEMSLFATPGKG